MDQKKVYAIQEKVSQNRDSGYRINLNTNGIKGFCYDTLLKINGF
jgi:hypothetical protein